MYYEGSLPKELLGTSGKPSVQKSSLHFSFSTIQLSPGIYRGFVPGHASPQGWQKKKKKKDVQVHYIECSNISIICTRAVYF